MADNLFSKGIKAVGSVFKGIPSSTSVTANTTTSLTSNDYFHLIGSYNSYKFGTNSDFLSDYHKCPPLSTIISRKSNAFTNGEVSIINRANGEEANGMEKYYKLLENPNPLQTQTQFESQLYTYLHIYGYAIVMKDIPYGFKSSGDTVSSMWVLPNQYLQVDWVESPYYLTNKKNRIKKIQFNINSKLYPIEKDNCYVYTHLNACPSGNVNKPDSPLCGLEYPIQNIILAYEASGSLIKNNGAMGILSNKGQYMDGIAKVSGDDTRQLQSDYKTKYGLGRDQWKVIITSLNLEYQQMSLPIRDLMLDEQIQSNTKAIADKLGYPTDLLGIGGNRTYQNANQASKDLYDMTIMPESKHFYQQQTECVFGTDSKYSIVSSFSHVPAMQEDEAERARAAKDWSYAYEKQWKSDLMTRNQMLEAQDKEPVNGGDMYYSEWLKTINPQNENEG